MKEWMNKAVKFMIVQLLFMIKFKGEPSNMWMDLHLVRDPRRQRIVARMIANESLVRTQFISEL